MIEIRTPIPVSEAVNLVMGHAVCGSAEHIPLEESYGRFLAQDLVAEHDVPPFDRSPYDGYAVRSIDTAGLSGEKRAVFQVVREIGAGSVFEGSIGYMQAVRIMTGAKLPEGADAVVMLELTKPLAGSKVELKREMKPGENISFRGEDTRSGTVLAEKGSFITPGLSALLAAFGYAEVPAAKKPVIGVLATGSELLNPDEPLEDGKIRNSNTYMLLSQIERAGGVPLYLGKFSDDLNQCTEAVQHALAKVDVLLTTGGVSVGDYDYLPDIYKRIGASVLFNKIAMRPGSVTTVAEHRGKLLFGLSGNPSACFVGFEMFVRPVIRFCCFSSRPHIRKEKAVLGSDFEKANPFTRFVRGTIVYEDGVIKAVPSGFDKSSAVSSLADANALIVLPGGTRGYKAGMKADILLLDDQKGSERQWENTAPSFR